jgi:hypothetical protein
MGWWSKIKKVWRWVKAVVRAVARMVVEVVTRVLNFYDFFLGFLTWPPKKLRIHIAILRNENGAALAATTDLDLAIQYATRVFKDRLNVKLLAYGKPLVQVLDGAAPTAALYVRCDGGAVLDELGEAGDYFAKHLAGWNAIPISLSFPITVFVVRDVDSKGGCSLGPFTDYVTVELDGVKSDSLMAHEIGHALGHFGHLGDSSNLMYKHNSRGDHVRWWQKNLFRNSRHVTYF